jgi:hypothetical protein
MSIAQVVLLSFLMGGILLGSVVPRVAAQPGNLSWMQTTNYPVNIATQSCVTSAGYVYCIGGVVQNSIPGGITIAYVNAVYYAPLSSAGVGAWSQTTSYPLSTNSQSCVVDSGYVYCIGGGSSAVYYAPLSSAGVGAWSQTTSYPIPVYAQGCAADSGYVYCTTGGSPTVFDTSATYYASLSSSGVGTWTPTTNYPIVEEAMPCVTDSTYIFCITNSGFPVYYAQFSSAGVGAWTPTTTYPPEVDAQSCVVDSGYVYCIGGESQIGGGGINNVYFASIGSSSGPSPVPEFNLPIMLVAAISMVALAVLVRMRSAKLRPQQVS